MKRIILAIMVFVTVFTLSACAQPTISETGYDLSDLETCIDGIVDAISVTGCEGFDRNGLLEQFVKSFESEFDTTGSVFTSSNVDFSSSKDQSEMRLEYWFQYALMLETQSQSNYEVYKEIIQTMVLELREINSEPEFLISANFFHFGDINYKYFSNANDELRGEILIMNLTNDFATNFTTYLSLLETYGIDSELYEQKLIITSSDHNVEVIVDVANTTYSYTIYMTHNEDTTTISEVETLIETAFNAVPLTLVE